MVGKPRTIKHRLATCYKQANLVIGRSSSNVCRANNLTLPLSQHLRVYGYDERQRFLGSLRCFEGARRRLETPVSFWSLRYTHSRVKYYNQKAHADNPFLNVNKFTNPQSLTNYSFVVSKGALKPLIELPVELRVERPIPYFPEWLY